MRNNKVNGDGVYIAAIFIIILATILVVAAICKFVEIAERGYDRADFECVSYTVKPGEKAWNIADRYCPAELDKRVYLEWCAEENGLCGMGSIQSGRRYIFLTLIEREE